jgi:hypothetical protein
MDNVNVPATPAVPAVNADISKAPVDAKAAINTSVDAKNVTKAEAEVIRKIKVGDTEYDETTLKSLIEKSSGADKKFLEAAKQRKEAVKFFKLAKENPKEFLRRTGVDPNKFAYDEVAEDIKNKMRDPREVELEAAQKRLKEFEAKEETAKAKRQAEKEEQQAKAFEQKLHAEMIEALEETPTLPKNGFTVAKIAKYIETVYNKTGTMLSPKDVVKVIERDIQSEMKGILSGADAQKIIALIGEEGMAAIRAYDVLKLKDPLKNGNPITGQAKPEERKRVRSNEFWKDIDRAAKQERGEYYGR